MEPKSDLHSGYHQLTLAPESWYIIVHLLPKRSLEIQLHQFLHQLCQRNLPEGNSVLQGSLNISDDVIVFGKSKTEYDKALEAVC